MSLTLSQEYLNDEKGRNELYSCAGSAERLLILRHMCFLIVGTVHSPKSLRLTPASS